MHLKLRSLRRNKNKQEQPTKDTSSSKLPPQKPKSNAPVIANRNVLFRDNKLPDGSHAVMQTVPRPRFPSQDSAMYGRAWSPTPSSVFSGGSNIFTAQPTLASYPASYLPSSFYEHDRSDLMRSQLPIQYQQGRMAYQELGIPKPDYPGSNCSNRDSGLDSESRSSSGTMRQPHQQNKLNVSAYICLLIQDS